MDEDSKPPGINQWQDRMLPWMLSVVLGTAILFAIVTLFQYQSIYSWMTLDRPPAVGDVWENDRVTPTNFEEQMKVANARALYALEHEAMRRRYESSRQAITNRLWVRFMGFLTGMIMAMVGSVFVLGRLSDGGNELAGEQGAIKLSLKSASPGIVLATLGTILIAISILTQIAVETDEVPIYFGIEGGYGSNSVEENASRGINASATWVDPEEDERSSSGNRAR